MRSLDRYTTQRTDGYAFRQSNGRKLADLRDASYPYVPRQARRATLNRLDRIQAQEKGPRRLQELIDADT
jgi:hypothetical protein